MISKDTDVTEFVEGDRVAVNNIKDASGDRHLIGSEGDVVAVIRDTEYNIIVRIGGVKSAFSESELTLLQTSRLKFKVGDRVTMVGGLVGTVVELVPGSTWPIRAFRDGRARSWVGAYSECELAPIGKKPTGTTISTTTSFSSQCQVCGLLEHDDPERHAEETGHLTTYSSTETTTARS